MIRAHIVTIAAIITLYVFLASSVSAHPAWGIVVDRQRQVYFSDLKTIWKIDAQGKLSVFRVGQDHTHDLNIDEAGNVYGAENSYDPATKRFFSAIWKMTPTGDFSYLLNAIEHPPNGTSIWKDRDGNMYHFVNYPKPGLLVLKRTPDGNVTALVGNRNAARSYRQDSPHSSGGTAFGADGALYFTNGSNVYKLTAGGTLSPLARDLVKVNSKEKPAGGTQLFGIAVDAQGNAFVADYGNRRVLKIAPDNRMTTVIRAGESWFPTGVAVRDGALYILEHSFTRASAPIGTRVRKLSADGKVSVLATVGENTNPAARATPVGAIIGSVPPRKGFSSYVLIGSFAGVLALSLVAVRAISRSVSGLRRTGLQRLFLYLTCQTVSRQCSSAGSSVRSLRFRAFSIAVHSL